MSDRALVVSLRTLPPQVGSRDECSLRWEVPSGWNTEVLELPRGAVVDLSVEFIAIEEGALVRVWAQSDQLSELRGECVRCLEPVSIPWTLDAAEVYEEEPRGGTPPCKHESASEDGIESEGDELDQVLRIDKDQVDLEPLLRDGILAAAPFQPLCSPDCLGICGHCGVRLADAGPDHSHEFLDPRFAALQGFFGEANEEDQ